MINRRGLRKRATDLEPASERVHSFPRRKRTARLYNEIEYEMALGEPENRLEIPQRRRSARNPGRSASASKVRARVNEPPGSRPATRRAARPCARRPCGRDPRSKERGAPGGGARLDRRAGGHGDIPLGHPARPAPYADRRAGCGNRPLGALLFADPAREESSAPASLASAPERGVSVSRRARVKTGERSAERWITCAPIET